MSDHGHILRLPAPEPVKPGSFGFLSAVFAVLAIVGAVLCLIGAIFDTQQFAYSWFFAFYFFFTLCAGALFWVLLHYVCNGSWDILIRRIWENLAALFPYIAILFLPLLIPPLRNEIWKWTDPKVYGDHERILRGGYLSYGFFYLRIVAYFAFFIAVSLWYRKRSVAQDADGNPAWTFKLHYHSYFLMTLWALIETFAGFDWFMGLDWRWSSSLFGAYHFAVCAQAGMAAVIVLAAWLQGKGYLGRLNHEHYHLAGKLLFGFTILWAYFAFGQFLLIWYANIPEETIFYNDHNRGNWTYLTYFLIVGKFMFPVIYLLAQDTKRSLRRLTFIALWILFMHAVEMWWFVMPYDSAAGHVRSLVPSWLDPVAFITIGSILGFAFLRIQASAALFPPRDPRLAECLTVTN